MAQQTQPPPLEELTPREREVLELLRRGLTNRQIAERLDVSADGAKYHVAEIIGKLGVRNRYEASVWPRRMPWWMGAFAPLGLFWRRLGWLPQIAAGGVAVGVAAGIGVLIWGLLRTSGDGSTPIVDETVAAVDHVTFSPGDTVATTGAGFYFIDARTGAVDGWVMSRLQTQAFSVSGMSADGRYVLYACQDHAADNSAVSCDPEATTPDLIWFYLDTQTGERTRLPDWSAYRSLSPDGRTVLGVTGRQLVLASVDDLEHPRAIMPDEELNRPADYWSPNSEALVLSRVDGTRIVRASDARTVPLFDTGPAAVGWSPNGSRVAVGLTGDAKSPELPSGTFVFDRDGNELWRSPITGFTPNPRWSPDGSQLAIDADSQPDVRALRLHVFDGASGEELYRIDGAIACGNAVWTADGSRLVVGSYTEQGSIVADPATQTFRSLAAPGTVPSPFDAALGVSFDGADFYSVNLETGAATLLAATTVGPGWDANHEPLFAGDRVAFAAPHGGHGGCLEGAAPDPLPELAFQLPPFAS